MGRPLLRALCTRLMCGDGDVLAVGADSDRRRMVVQRERPGCTGYGRARRIRPPTPRTLSRVAPASARERKARTLDAMPRPRLATHQLQAPRACIAAAPAGDGCVRRSHMRELPRAVARDPYKPPTRRIQARRCDCSTYKEIRPCRTIRRRARIVPPIPTRRRARQPDSHAHLSARSLRRMLTTRRRMQASVQKAGGTEGPAPVRCSCSHHPAPRIRHQSDSSVTP